VFDLKLISIFFNKEKGKGGDASGILPEEKKKTDNQRRVSTKSGG